MKIIINGEGKEFEIKDLEGLLGALKLNLQTILVEHNGVVVPQGNNINLSDGDRLELVRFIGGG
ncbi:sulfur carrier protein ThiS [Candidatus Margulisiibacteriota bacterium]